MRRRLAVPALTLALLAPLAAHAEPQTSAPSTQQILSTVATRQATVAAMAQVGATPPAARAAEGSEATTEATSQPEQKKNKVRRNALLALILYRQKVRIGH